MYGERKRYGFGERKMSWYEDLVKTVIKLNICGIEFDTIEALNAHKRMEHSEISHLPAGIG
jgi:hypothetical protein